MSDDISTDSDDESEYKATGSVRELYNCATKVNLISDFQPLSKAPITCLIQDCRKIMSSREVFSHFVGHHRDIREFTVKNVKEHEKYVMKLSYAEFPFGKNICLGVMAYRGKLSKSSNISLPKQYEGLTKHLPVLIIGCKTWSSVAFASCLQDSQKWYKKCEETNNPNDYLLCIWLVTAALEKPLFATMKARSMDRMLSMETQEKVRSFSDAHDVQEFVYPSHDSLNMTNGFMGQITEGFETSFELELKLHEKLIIDEDDL